MAIATDIQNWMGQSGGVNPGLEQANQARASIGLPPLTAAQYQQMSADPYGAAPALNTNGSSATTTNQNISAQAVSDNQGNVIGYLIQTGQSEGQPSYTLIRQDGTPISKPMSYEQAVVMQQNLQKVAAPGYNVGMTATESGGYNFPYTQQDTQNKGGSYEEVLKQLASMGELGAKYYPVPSTTELGKWTIGERPGAFTPTPTTTPYQQSELALQQQRLQWEQASQQQQLDLQKQQHLAQLKANPGSWLEYAAASGTAPVVQPWMQPLMPQQYQGTQAGAALPGWSAQSQSNQALPELAPPSAQYMARISPSAREQYYGYEQARTGATPADVQWRLWSMAPPSGQSPALRFSK